MKAFFNIFPKDKYICNYILGCTSCRQIQVTFKGEPRNGHQYKKNGTYKIMDGHASGRDIWSTKNVYGEYYIWYSNLFKKWAIGSENEMIADIDQNSFVNNERLAGIVSEENFLECPFDIKSEKWSYYSDLGMTRAEENEINVVCSEFGKKVFICLKIKKGMKILITYFI